jgi:hypothetical protein
MGDRFVLDGAIFLSRLLELIFSSFASFLAGELLSLGECIRALIGSIVFFWDATRFLIEFK